MNFEMFWDILKNELGKEKKFKTLVRKNEFTAKFQYNKNREAHIIIIVNSERNVERREFEGVWDNSKACLRKTRFENIKELESYTRQDGKLGKSTHVSYIASLIDHIVKDENMV